MSRYQQSSNPFDDDDDNLDSDFVMVGNKKNPNAQAVSSTNRGASSSQPQDRYQKQSHYSSYDSHYHEENSPFEDRRQQMMRKIENSENTQLESTQRALASIYDSEAMGVATAEELVRQGETLDNIENKTDTMQQNLTTSQKHLNNIKSVFGGFKNWWSGDKNKKSAQETRAEENPNARLRATIEKTERSKPDVRGFYDDEENDLDSKFMAGARKPGSVAGGYKVISPVTRTAREEEIDSNLQMMGEGMARLKGLAAGLGDEIERQNDQLDRINVKVDGTDDLLSHQNTQMRRILKK
ncbi:synaptosomal-associated protein 29 [Aplysia californica]|uniref:Synaptosomal-associated protein 29 n=1 Tax=Aplysia californica TaxID=6500 RepID=A0ABM1AEX4_APLCA|nr:synaptosomal-associated protein 29 [Aplysia californica]